MRLDILNRGYGAGAKVLSAVLADLDSAPISQPLQATLRMLGTLTREGTLAAEDMRAVLAAGAGYLLKRGYR
jgi:hypothetical protein